MRPVSEFYVLVARMLFFWGSCMVNADRNNTTQTSTSRVVDASHVQVLAEQDMHDKCSQPSLQESEIFHMKQKEIKPRNLLGEDCVVLFAKGKSA